MFKAIGVISSTYFARHSILFDYSSEVNTYAHAAYDVAFTYLSKSLAIS